MKPLLIIFLLTFTISTDALADKEAPSDEVYAAQITDFDVNQTWFGRIDQGSIRLNLKEETMTLTLSSKLPCAPGMFCAAVMEEFHQIVLSLDYKFTDRCGVVHYFGSKDKTPVDGLLEKIYVQDYSAMICEIAVPRMTTITYETFNPWTQKIIRSYFGADALSQLPSYF